jgi:two-component system OmpR family response regulator
LLLNQYCNFTELIAPTRKNQPKMLNLSQLEFLDKHIVIVEDDMPSVKYYETVLKYTGAKITVLRNGKEFIDFIESGIPAPDFIIMDYLIPYINGAECIRRLRKTNKTTPVVMITAYYSEQTKNESFVAGCNDYVLKPVFPEKLVVLLEQYLTQKEYIRH